MNNNNPGAEWSKRWDTLCLGTMPIAAATPGAVIPTAGLPGLAGVESVGWVVQRGHGAAALRCILLLSGRPGRRGAPAGLPASVFQNAVWPVCYRFAAGAVRALPDRRP